MREIKFRCWDKQGKLMIYFDRSWLCEEYSSICWGSSEPELYGIGRLPGSYGYLNDDIDNYERMQYIGLKDKNGKEIYERDIVLNNDCLYIVKFGKYDNGEEYEDKIYGYGWYLELARGKDWTQVMDLLYPEEYEIVGNIYENPELLNEKETSSQSNKKD